jgi:hypothetical protein
MIFAIIHAFTYSRHPSFSLVSDIHVEDLVRDVISNDRRKWIGVDDDDQSISQP